jgi:hypothetical protein
MTEAQIIMLRMLAYIEYKGEVPYDKICEIIK